MFIKFNVKSAANVWLALFAATFFLSACEPPQSAINVPVAETNANVGAPINTANTNKMATPQPPANAATAVNLPVTLPVLDAMFADENFAAEIKSKLGLSDDQIEQLRNAAREARESLSEDETGGAGSTTESTRNANERIRAVIGEEKTQQLAQFVRERWEKGGEGGTATVPSAQQPNAVPTDTRIVVNAPAYRMDVFRDGRLVKSYKVGIGYPEFPLPTGMRQASTVIFNPTWTPPDEPWVKGKVQPGKKVEAGSALNPLGPIKIPIGSPSLIHGGKQPARLGGFASHGCVGLTNPQVQEFAVVLAQLSGSQISDADVKNYEKNKTETKNVKLNQPVAVELRYETIVVEDGKLKIYRDVYERGTNTEENLRAVLQTHGVSFDSLSEQERAKALEALKQMARDAQGNVADPATVPEKNTSEKETRTIKGAKEATVEIAALKGKGYPAPVDLNTGAKSAKPLNLNAAPSGNANGNSNRQANVGRF
jgi:lipoprotein-anchoring transpeptidase ErfK/SrfK